MGRRCCVTGCQSTSRLPEHQGVTYHTFPLDPAIRSIWLKYTRCPPDKQITKSVLVCSRHFRRADFNPIKNGKYMLKHRVFPTVFPWGKVEPEQVTADQEYLKQAVGQNAPATAASTSQPSLEDVTKATVAATVAQILAETRELNAAAGISTKQSSSGSSLVINSGGFPLIDSDQKPEASSASPSSGGASSPCGFKYEPVTVFTQGLRLEAQVSDGVWHFARVVEVDYDDREVLIRFDRVGRNKTPVDGTEEWIPMNSNRLRQKVSTKPIPVFEVEEKCLARWSGPRKFPGTVKKALGGDMYEVLFDDGYTKNVRAQHMTKINESKDSGLEAGFMSPQYRSNSDTSAPGTPIQNPFMSLTAPLKSAGDIIEAPTTPPVKKRASPGSRKDWPLLDLSKLDLSALNLPIIPKDGEWTCHWVNDQPIGEEGYLIVGEHRKPTVIVDDWRLPPGWVKHMYQRSNVSGKWDVILVSPNGKRFRSKSDLKTYLEEKGELYNPDIYDFSIHRRRAKDINAYVYTSDYTPQQPPVKPKPSLETTLDMTLDEKAAIASSLEKAVLSKCNSQYLETPIASATPPMELMTSPTIEKMSGLSDLPGEAPKNDIIPSLPTTPSILNEPVADPTPLPPLEDGYVYIGGLKVQLVNNLFRCPEESCSKHFRKENHLQIHVKHYHRDLAKLLVSCPKMLELAAKRTHTISAEITEPAPKNQIPNQQFFAKLHQQDIEQSRSHKRSVAAAIKIENEIKTTTPPPIKVEEDVKLSPRSIQAVIDDIKIESPVPPSSVGSDTIDLKNFSPLTVKKEEPPSNELGDSAMLETSLASTKSEPSPSKIPKVPSDILSTNSSPTLSHKTSSGSSSFRHRFGQSMKRDFGSRRSSRQRTTRRFLTAAQTHFSSGASSSHRKTNSDNFGISDLEETRHSFNVTPDIKKGKSFSHSGGTPSTPLSSVGSSPLITADSNDTNDFNNAAVINSKSFNESTEKYVRMKKSEIINCLCGYGEEDGLMIRCDLCYCWQHAICNGLENEDDVPDPYYCYICRHPQKARELMGFNHDQTWLYEGQLPTANFHSKHENLAKRFEFLKKTHSVTGNLLTLKNFMHSLRSKINIATNRNHPKLYLWATQWDPEDSENNHTDSKPADEEKNENKDGCSEPKKPKMEEEPTFPNVPQPEAAIDPEECQERLQKHIRYHHNLLAGRLDALEAEINILEKEDDLAGEDEEVMQSTKDILTVYMRDLDVLRKIARINRVKHMQKLIKQQQQHQAQQASHHHSSQTPQHSSNT